MMKKFIFLFLIFLFLPLFKIEGATTTPDYWQNSVQDGNKTFYWCMNENCSLARNAYYATTTDSKYYYWTQGGDFFMSASTTVQNNVGLNSEGWKWWFFGNEGCNGRQHRLLYWSGGTSYPDGLNCIDVHNFNTNDGIIYSSTQDGFNHSSVYKIILSSIDTKLYVIFYTNQDLSNINSSAEFYGFLDWLASYNSLYGGYYPNGLPPMPSSIPTNLKNSFPFAWFDDFATLFNTLSATTSNFSSITIPMKLGNSSSTITIFTANSFYAFLPADSWALMKLAFKWILWFSFGVSMFFQLKRLFK